jgi:hypothetical protein
MKILGMILVTVLAFSAQAESQRTLTSAELVSCLSRLNKMWKKPGAQLVTVSDQEFYLLVPHEENMNINTGVIHVTPYGYERCDLNWIYGKYLKFNFNGVEVNYDTDGSKGDPNQRQNIGAVSNCKTGKENKDIQDTSDTWVRKQIAETAGRLAATGEFCPKSALEKAIGKTCMTVDRITDRINENYHAACTRSGDVPKQPGTSSQ